VLNDDLIADVLHTLLRGWSVYKNDRYLAGAVRAGEFLLLAQMPEPQPAWCQQYDKNMQPVWGRAFEVTASQQSRIRDRYRSIAAPRPCDR